MFRAAVGLSRTGSTDSRHPRGDHRRAKPAPPHTLNVLKVRDCSIMADEPWCYGLNEVKGQCQMTKLCSAQE